MRIFTINLMLVFFLSFNSYAYKTIRIGGVDNRDVIREDTLRENKKYGDYDIKIYMDWDIGTDGVVQIFKGGELVFEEQGHKYYTYDGSYVDDKYKMKIGDDLTGDGVPNLVIMQWSGGAHCCYDTYLFSIGEEFSFIEKFEGEHGTPVFEDIDNDGVYEVSVNDWAFAYWNECFAGSPAPSVVFRFKDGRYQVAYELMKKPLEEIEEKYKKEMEENKDYYSLSCDEGFSWKKDDYCIKSNVWGHMLSLIYGGYPELAWKFLDDVWGSTEENKQAFLSDFNAQLAISDYFQAFPVELKGYGSEIEDASDKKDYRFWVYYDAMKKALEKHGVKGDDEVLKDPISSKTINDALKGWSGQR